MPWDNNENSADDEVDFGFRRVAATDKARLVRGVFERVARRYDLMNDLMSGGIHRLWKREMVEWLKPRAGMTLIDVAGGTGDIAFRVLDRLGGPGHGRIIVCDLSEPMVAAGRDRAWDRGILDGIEWLVGDAEALPLAANSVDAYTIAFGIRNFTRIDAALREAARVLRPGGRFLCLEFSPDVAPGLGRLYDAYSFAVIPLIGSMVAHDADAYRYLVESIRRFPAPEAFAAKIGAAGLGGVHYRRLSGGIAALHSAYRV
jgi:demethylmenaquinone methyltransferase/2-methoxy-6-polyprenyl-1,4-benzoquinol methylase